MTPAGNARYRGPRDIPTRAPVFPLPGALLLPRAQMPLNVFEPRYVAMIDAALAADRVLVMVQPRLDVASDALAGRPPLLALGTIGRITQFAETGDGRYLMTLVGICRVRLVEEIASLTPFRVWRITAQDFAGDFEPGRGEAEVDRPAVVAALRAYLEAHDLRADWESIDKAPNEALVNALSMMSPYGPAEKQALLEAPDLKARAETLVAITEIALAKQAGDASGLLQ